MYFNGKEFTEVHYRLEATRLIEIRFYVNMRVSVMIKSKKYVKWIVLALIVAVVALGVWYFVGS